MYSTVFANYTSLYLKFDLSISKTSNCLVVIVQVGSIPTTRSNHFESLGNSQRVNDLLVRRDPSAKTNVESYRNIKKQFIEKLASNDENGNKAIFA